MNQNKVIVFGVIVVLIAIFINATLYRVDERQKSIVIQLGKVVRYDDEAGLHWKLPLVQEVRYFDSRILTLDAEPQRYLTAEKKSVVVDSFVKWRIINTLKYYLTASGSESQAKTLLQQRINSGLRDEFGKRSLSEVVSGDRRIIMDILTENTNTAMQEEFGIEVVDVRIQRVDLPVEVSQAVYQRMNAERTRIANELRAQGAEAAEKLRAEAERKRKILVAEAYRDGEQIRGDGDAKATAIYARAFNRNPDFYSFYRSLIAYRESFQDKSDIMIVDPSSDFFKYLKKKRGN